MFNHRKALQYAARPDRPDPLFAKMLQEPLGGQWGEISVMMSYLWQGWSCRGPQKYRDMILDIGTEEIGHVEMLATMIARLLETSPVEAQEEAARNGAVGANLCGAGIKDASGNLLADFRFNLTAESQGRLQVARLYNLTQDDGVRDMLSFLIARDTMHQNQWLAAIRELEEEGYDSTPVPAAFPQDREMGEVAYRYIGASEGGASRDGRWAGGPSADGRGEFDYDEIRPLADDDGLLGEADPRLYGTAPVPTPPMAAE